MKFRSGIFLLMLSLAAPVLVKAQMGGEGVFKFVNLPPSSRTASLGGNLISVKDNDITLAIQNPGLLNPTMDRQMALTYMDHLADMNFGSVVYGFHSDKGNISGMGGLQYINYGTFVRTDDNGNKGGTFSAGEYSFFGGAARSWKRFSYGAAMKVIYSQYAEYNAMGIGLDLGGVYEDTAHGFTGALVFKNIGTQINTFAGTSEALPFEIQAGISLKPKHMPIRFSFIFHDLQDPDFTYINTNKKPKENLATGEIEVEKIPFSEVIARHLIVGGEIILSKNFNLRVGYNHQRRKELLLEDARGLVGYSFGVGLRVNRFHISYGRAIYHVAGGTNTFTVVTNLNSFSKKKEVVAPVGATN